MTAFHNWLISLEKLDLIFVKFYEMVHQVHTKFITELHEMQTRSSDENSVYPSVRLSVWQTRAL